ncbi:MAG: aldo/keto reductase [Chthoniobacterales bacterium]
MKTRRFGRTEIQIPVLSCGGMRYQESWNDLTPEDIPTAGQNNLEATIQRALELGINHIETARGYGSSEMQLGFLLPRLDREKLIIQTKLAPQETREKFIEAFELSLKNLQLDYVDLFSIHGINNAEVLAQTLAPGGALECAQQFQREGRVRHIGFSTHGTCAEITKALKTDAFSYVNLHWYFVNDLNWPAILEAEKRDIGVFIISPNDKGGKLYDPPKKLVDLCAPLTPMAFNDLYCLSRPQVHTLSIGASKPSDFDAHIEALKHYDSRAETIAPIEMRLRSEMNRVLGADWTANWWKNIPEYHELPGEINVLEILRLWSLAKSLDLVSFGKMRYNLLGNAGHWFPGTNAKTFDAHALAPLLAGSAFADRIPQILTEANDILLGEEVQRLSKSD